MNDVENTEAEFDDWQAAVADLSRKLNREAWGASLEGDGMGSLRLRVYIENASIESIVIKETGGKICNYPLVFTTYKYKDHCERMKMIEERENDEEAG